MTGRRDEGGQGAAPGGAASVRRYPGARWRARLGPALVVVAGALALASLPRCGQQHALLLTLRAQSLVETFDLRVKDLSTGKLILERVGERVDSSNPNRDISQPDQALRVAIEFGAAGNYLVHIVGRGGQGAGGIQFALRDFQVDGVQEVGLTLVPLGRDEDDDGFPACNSPGFNCQVMACTFFDCNDREKQVHPFAKEICGNGRDDDCSATCRAQPGEGDEVCTDSDGDGVPSTEDCDDNDPCRSPRLKEAEDLCKAGQDAFPALPKACLDKLAKEGKTAPAAPFCGDGIDEDCNGQDTSCKTDDDCDGYAPPIDCDDKDKKVNPGAQEACDGIDNNCNKVTDEGCVPCDVDGDGHALATVTDPSCTVPRDDPDDYDAGIFPGSTKDSEGKEGGTVLGGLRQFCGTGATKDGGALRQRDVDHDADGKAAKDDGCPTETCDKDGDGFAGAQCSPPQSQLDCDDADPRAFPGAPDKCGDGKRQNCVSDFACAQVTDKDGDGFAPPADCNDNDKTVYPWAVEKCDKLDNDCDGLVDEGNPDSSGALVPTNVGKCNDDNDGKCGPVTGICACSPLKPVGTRDEGNRVTCAGEDLAAPASARCFRAIQPQPERCDTDDWDCNKRPDDPQGVNLADKGKSCGNSVGSCKAGTVTGCDLSRKLPNADLVARVMAAQGVEFNPNWVCTGAELPVPEACNGKDDDCDRVLPNEEKDPDADKFLQCAGCNQGTGRLDLAAGLKGCADCDASSPSVFPGALETCNGVDDNCASGITDDGKDQCAAGTVCCSSQGQCRALGNDKDNCGGCGRRCNGPDVDSCAGSTCVCGATGGPCAAGLNCVNGQCLCIANGRCSGCCENSASCRATAAQSASSCGRNGETCRGCADGNECTLDQCNSGVCGNPARQEGAACNGSSGQCHGAACCSGCWDGGTCHAGNTNGQCGRGGDWCGSCSTSQACKVASCATGSCSIGNVGDGTGCNDGQRCTLNDQCTGGVCGGTPRVCTPSGECKTASCNPSNGNCTEQNKSNGTSCGPGGNWSCQSGVCVPPSTPDLGVDAGADSGG
ncbi:MAG: hypothetical protein IT371_13315 [Deltaproteobacteria bacterium]|nr:hypothetical protein [Deltaproteobacteria bacterium]